MAVSRRRHGSATVPPAIYHIAKTTPNKYPATMAASSRSATTRKVIKIKYNNNNNNTNIPNPSRDFGSSLKLSETNTMRLLELYRGEPCLYDVNDRCYVNRELRAAAAGRIADALAIDGFGPREVVTKFKNLRNSYSQEMKKLKYNGETFGVQLDEANAPKVYWFNLMDSYLRPFLYHRSREHTNKNIIVTHAPRRHHVQTATGYKKPSSHVPKRDSLLLTQVKEEALFEEVQAADPLEISDTSETESSHQPSHQPQQEVKRRKTTPVAPERSGGQHKIIVTKQTARQNASSSGVMEQSNIIDLDEHEVVGINVTKKLTRMDPTQAVYAESLIHQVLVKGLLNQLSGSTSLQDFSAGDDAKDMYKANPRTFKYENRCASPIGDNLSSDDDDIREVIPSTF